MFSCLCDIQSDIFNIQTSYSVFKFEIYTLRKYHLLHIILLADLGKHRVKWEDVSRGEEPKIQYNGTPFIILGWDVRECQFGPDRNVTKKLKYQLEKVS